MDKLLRGDHEGRLIVAPQRSAKQAWRSSYSYQTAPGRVSAMCLRNVVLPRMREPKGNRYPIWELASWYKGSQDAAL